MRTFSRFAAVVVLSSVWGCGSSGGEATDLDLNGEGGTGEDGSSGDGFTRDGATTEEAVLRVCGKSISDVERELRQWGRAERRTFSN